MANTERTRRNRIAAAKMRQLPPRPTPPAGTGLPLQYQGRTLREGRRLYVVDYTANEIRVTPPLVATAPAGPHGLWLVFADGTKRILGSVEIDEDDAQRKLDRFRAWAWRVGGCKADGRLRDEDDDCDE